MRDSDTPFPNSFDPNSALGESLNMKAAPDLPLQLVNTLRVIGLRAEALKAILSDMPACERPVADTVLNQLEDTLVVVETAWTLLSGLPGEAPLEPPKRLLN